MASALRQARERGGSASILMGAGMSVSAGIPLANGFVEVVRSRDPAAYARAVEKTYPQVLGALEVGPRHDIIAEHVERARLNWAHILLGVLVQRGYIGRILTTNFDNLSLRCTGLYGVYPAVYDVTALTKFDASLIRDPAILFLHGQHRGFVQLHARADVTRNAKVLRPIFADATVRRPWLVLGYSGDNDPVFECLSRVKTDRWHFDAARKELAPVMACTKYKPLKVKLPRREPITLPASLAAGVAPGRFMQFVRGPRSAPLYVWDSPKRIRLVALYGVNR